MNKRELISKTVDVLKENDCRKHVGAQKTTLHVSDDSGNTKDFVMKKEQTGLLFTINDVTRIIDAALAVAEDAIKHGEEVNIHGFGSLGVNYRKERLVRHPDTGEMVLIDGHYVPKFTSGNLLKMAAKVYELSLNDKEV